MRGVLGIALVLIGCGSARASVVTPTTPARVTVELGVQTNPRPAALPSHSLWRGRYVCGQGVTALTLTLDIGVGARATAVFDFGASPENPSVPSGRYLLVGTIESALDGSASVRLVPDRWIARPSGYEMVGLSAQIDPSARVMRGIIDYAGCGGLELSRAQ